MIMNSNITIFTETDGVLLIKSLLQSVVIIIFIFSVCIMSFLGFLFNKNKSLLKWPVNYFIINIIMVDSFKLLISIPLVVYSLEIIANDGLLRLSYTSQNLLCNANALLTALFETIQLISFAAVSFERHRMVKFPLMSLNIRIRLTKKLILVSWCLAIFLSFLLYITISKISNFKNLDFQFNECYLDFFHIFVFRSLNGFLLPASNITAKISSNQNIIFDSYNLIITVFSLTVSISFYTSISFFLKQHKIEMDAKFHLSEQHKNKINFSLPSKNLALDTTISCSLANETSKSPNQEFQVFDFNGNVHLQDKREDAHVQGSTDKMNV